MAIAPPFTLTFSGSSSSSRKTGSACAANASFSSTRSISATVRPARSSALRDAGIGPRPIVAGSTPATALETSRAIVDAAAVAGRYRAGGVALERGLERPELFEGGFRPWVLVTVHGRRGVLGRRRLDGNDLVGEAPGRLRGRP